jgi:hypothetical protein
MRQIIALNVSNWEKMRIDYFFIRFNDVDYADTCRTPRLPRKGSWPNMPTRTLLAWMLQDLEIQN